MYLITNTQIQFLLITRACVLKYKHTNTTSNKNHPYFLDTNKQIQGLINLKRNVFLITNTQIQGLMNHKHNNTNTRSKWQAGQVEQVVLGGAGSGRDQVEKKHLGYFLQEPGCLRGLHLPEGDSGTSTTTVTLLLQIGIHSIIVPPLSYRAPVLKFCCFLTTSCQWGQRLPHLSCGDARPSSPSGRPRQRIR